MSAVIVFVGCFALWLVLSGHPTPLHLVQGALSAALVAYLNRDLETLSVFLRSSPRFVAYIPWLLKEIVVANVQVVRIVLHPRLPVDPSVVRVRTRLTSDLALTTFANSITLTPGTITVDVEGSEFVVHALTRQGPEAFAGMERRVAAVFGEPVQ
jgi:multicomponent Na+:H+ antiporter subunit E